MKKIIKKSNAPLIIAIVAFIIYAIGQGPFQAFGLDIFSISLSIWSWGEIRSDHGRFRRTIGWAALIAMAILLFFVLNGKVGA